MLPVALAVSPGVSTQKTPLQNEGGISYSNLIRFKEGLIQKQGGCQRLSSQTFSGTARALFAWQDLAGFQYLAIGTNQRLELMLSGNLYDITPIVHTSNLTNNGANNGFSTTLNSSTVTVYDSVYTPEPNQWINIVNATYIGGLVLQGYFQVLTVGSGNYTINVGALATANAVITGAVVDFTTTIGMSTINITLGTYVFTDMQTLNVGVTTMVGGITITAEAYSVSVSGPTYSIMGSSVASSSTSGFENGGNTQIEYLEQLPAETFSSGAFGAGPFGAGPFGVGGLTGTEIELVEWTFDKFGQNLVAAFRTGPVLQWVPPIASGNVAAAVSGAPSAVNGVYAAAPSQQIIAFGIFSSVLGEQDPLLVGWCDVDNLNQWTASATNQAGTYRLTSGSRIVAGIWVGTIGLLWTDLDCWIQTYIGFPLIYGFNQIARNCGLISLRAVAVMGTIVEWMSQNDFFVEQGGAVAVLPCTVRDFVFNNLDTNYVDAVFAAPNTYFNEITWWFPTVGSNGVCDAWVRHNVTENLWDCGPNPAPPMGFPTLEVSAWTDQSVLGAPIGAFYTGLIEQFEISNDIDGTIYDSYFQTGWFQLAQGEEFINLDRILWDILLTGTNPQVNVTVYVADYMEGAPIQTFGPYTVTPTTPFTPDIGARGRLCMLRLDCITANTFWRYGKPLAVISISGRGTSR